LKVLIKTERTSLSLEKNERINISKYQMNKGAEDMPVAIPSGLTLNILLANTKQLMSNKFLAYSSYDNNCGNFVLAILRSNNLSTSQNVSFTEQTIKHLFTPQLRKISNTITDVAGKIDIIRQGGDIKPAKSSNPWIEHVRQFAKDNNVTYFQALKDIKCKTTYRKVKGHGVGSSKIIPAEEEKEESVSEFIDPNIPMKETMEKHFKMKVKHDREAYDRERKRQERQEAKELEEFYTYMALSDSEKDNRLTDIKYNRFYIEESRRIQKEETRLKEEEKAEKLKIEQKRRRKQF
jgi:hypothetical protein